jgi:hypothetical protein
MEGPLFVSMKPMYMHSDHTVPHSWSDEHWPHSWSGASIWSQCTTTVAAIDTQYLTPEMRPASTQVTGCLTAGLRYPHWQYIAS